MSHVTYGVPLGALRSRLDVLLNRYRPTLALDEDRLRAAMREFEHGVEQKSAETQPHWPSHAAASAAPRLRESGHSN